MESIYFYTKNTTTKRNSNSGLLESFYQVINVPLSKRKNVDEAERKARTIANKRSVSLAGGYFNSSCKPYNLDSNYTVIPCPINTKIQPYNDKDLFIIGVIESGY